MSKMPIAQLPAKLYELLLPLSAEERQKVVGATFMLLGEQPPAGGGPTPAMPPAAPQPQAPLTGGGDPSDPKAFLDQKDPKNKGETLAVAARFRELSSGVEEHSKADLKAVITGAKRNFDDNNFARDINNAKRQAGLFNLGTGRDAHKLSYYGEQFVDALPDREAAVAIKRPKVGGSRKGTSSKKAGRKKPAN